MANPGFWESIARDLSGPGMLGGKFQFRLVAQPLGAVILGVRFGIRDAKHGRPPFLKALHAGEENRRQLLQQAARDAIVPLVVALLTDSILQQLINHRIRPVAALVVGGLLVFLPFLIVRALTNRIWTHGHPGQGRRATQSR